MKTCIYQIFYSTQTRRLVDTAFTPLDNTNNERPDWREYWPMRQRLLAEGLQQDCCYGFFSPRFFQKTQLHGKDVKTWLATVDADVVSFSPFFMESAFDWNALIQGDRHHDGLLDLFMQMAPELGVDPERVNQPMSFRESIFSNYFVARPAFWQRWLEWGETVFRIAEDTRHPLSARLNAMTPYDGNLLPMKIFVVERLVTLLLLSEPQWRVRSYFPFESTGPSQDSQGGGAADLTRNQAALLLNDIMALDSLKRCYQLDPNIRYLDAYKGLRTASLQRRARQIFADAGRAHVRRA